MDFGRAGCSWGSSLALGGRRGCFFATAVEVVPFESASTIGSLIAQTVTLEPEGFVVFDFLEFSEGRGPFSSNVWCLFSVH